MFVSFVQSFTILSGYACDVARSAEKYTEAKVIVLLSSLLYAGFFAVQITVFIKGLLGSGGPALVILFVVWVFITFTAFGVVELYFTFKEPKSEDKKSLRFNQELSFAILSFTSKASFLNFSLCNPI